MELVLLSMLIFQIKHFLCDFVLQTSSQIRSKGNYMEAGGLVHAGLHALGSFPALWILIQAPGRIVLLLLVEFVIHYHTDWGKAQIDRKLRLNDTNKLYWTIFGTDQLVHQLTYLGMVYGALRVFQ